ncbi:hypothetical protein PMAYCL1PPCAC_27335, partial [Pristionchus mayeri]
TKKPMRLRMLFKLESGHNLRMGLKPALLKCIARINILQAINVDLTYFTLIRECVESVVVRRLIVRVKMHVTRDEFKMIKQQAA